jgi:rhomboid protease GluP
MDANTVLAWMIGTWSAAIVATVYLRKGAKSWAVINAAVLGVLALGMWAFRAQAGFVAAALWVPAVGAPMSGSVLLRRRVEAQRFADAARIAKMLCWMHPSAAWLSQAKWLEAFELEQRGETDRALEKLAVLAKDPYAAQTAKALELRWQGRYAELRVWVEEPEQALVRRREPTILLSYFRALGELGDVDALARVYASEIEARPNAAGPQAALLLAVFGGRVRATETLLLRRLAHMPEMAKSLWLLTARQRAGEDVTEELEDFARRAPIALQRVARERLARGVSRVAPTPEALATLARLDRDVASIPEVGLARSVATLTLAGLNLYVFAREIPGGTTNAQNLYGMGALLASSDFAETDAWRLAAAACLHLGALHAGLNVFALLLLGRQLEARVGSWRTVTIYVVAALGGNAAYVAYIAWTHREPILIVGASGAIMGVVGALAVAAWRRFRRDGTGLARRQVIGIASVPIFQVVFDAFTPQVAMAVHLFGLVIGAGVALLLGEPHASARPPSPSLSRLHATVAIGLGLACIFGLEWAWAKEATRSAREENGEQVGP